VAADLFGRSPIGRRIRQGLHPRRLLFELGGIPQGQFARRSADVYRGAGSGGGGQKNAPHLRRRLSPIPEPGCLPVAGILAGSNLPQGEGVAISTENVAVRSNAGGSPTRPPAAGLQGRGAARTAGGNQYR